MNYVLTYWVPPEMSCERREALRLYFDLQRHTKHQFGAKQIIVSNLDYDGAVPFTEPKGFTRKHGLFAKYFGLGQLIDDGLEFPIAMHDHDMFLRQALVPSNSAILCCSGSDHSFSDQLAIFPHISKNALTGYIDRLRAFDFYAAYNVGYGADIRHEKMYSTEIARSNMRPNPFADIDVEIAISYRDLVSFDIKGQHPLDSAHCECNFIPSEVQAVHGHINKGPATDALVEWLNQ